MIEAAPEDGSRYFAMWQLLAEGGNPEEADAWFDQAIDRNPYNPWWWVVRASTARDAGDVSYSLEIYHAALERFPGNASLYFEMARAHQLYNNQALAIQAIENAIAYMARQNAWYFVRAGEIYEWTGDLAKARSAYINALEIDPGNSVAHKTARQYLARLDAEGN